MRALVCKLGMFSFHYKPAPPLRVLTVAVQVKSKLGETGAAFAALSSMMSSEHIATQMTGIELFENLAASDMDATSQDGHGKGKEREPETANAKRCRVNLEGGDRDRQERQKEEEGERERKFGQQGEREREQELGRQGGRQVLFSLLGSAREQVYELGSQPTSQERKGRDSDRVCLPQRAERAVGE